MASKTQAFLWRLLALLPIPVLWAFISNFGHLRFFDDLLLKYRYQFRGELHSLVRVVYVDIDTKSISELHNFPWPRDYFSDVCGALVREGGVNGIGIDIVFSEKGRSNSYDLKRWWAGNRELVKFLNATPRVVVAASYVSAEDMSLPDEHRRVEFPMIREGLPPLDDIPMPEVPELEILNGQSFTPARVGLIDTLNGGTQWIPLFAPTGIKRYDHMALNLALLRWGVAPEALRITDRAIDVPGPDGQLIASIPLTDQQLVEINWFSPWESDENPRVSFSTAYKYVLALKSDNPELQAKAREFFSQFKDATVLIGPVDPLLQDLAPTPFDDAPVPKVGVHGNMLKTLVSGEFLRRLPLWQVFPLTIALTLVVTALVMMGGRRGLWQKAAGLLILAGFVLGGFVVFRFGNLVLPMAAPIGATFTTAFAGIIWQLVVEERQKGRIKSLFGTYLSPELVNRMVESAKDPELGGHEEVITAYFSDIQSFSTFSELMPASQLVELMNEYLTACTDIIQEERGTLDKYIGDAVVAIYGAPVELKDHAYRACVSTIRVQARIEELRQKWRSEGGKWPHVVHYLRARLGLNTGQAIIGNMGSRSRFSYTMMGDNVNLAARMESGAKSLGVYTMCTEATKDECQKHGDDVLFRFLDKIVVKGRTLPVPVHEIVGFRKEVPQRTHDCLGIHAEAIRLYLAQDWAGAAAKFEESAALEPNQPNKKFAIESNPSLIMIERCRYMQNHPPGDNWDGVWTMKEK